MITLPNRQFATRKHHHLARPIQALFLMGCIITSTFAADTTIATFPNLKINIDQQQVHMDAKVCLQAGQLEYIVCRPGSYEHESIFTSLCHPEHLHAALLLLDTEPFPLRDERFEIEQGLHPRAHLHIQVTWSDDSGKRYETSLESLLSPPSPEGEPIAPLPPEWVFTGSFFMSNGESERYAANADGALIALVLFPSAVVQYGYTMGDPQRSPETATSINSEVCPPVGTTVKLIISRR